MLVMWDRGTSPPSRSPWPPHPPRSRSSATAGSSRSHADGSGRTLLVAPPKGENVGNPVWSPDGTDARLHHRRRGGRADHARDAPAPRELTPKRANVTESGLTWSPDGTQARLLARGSPSPSDTITTARSSRETSRPAPSRCCVTQKIDGRLSARLRARLVAGRRDDRLHALPLRPSRRRRAADPHRPGRRRAIQAPDQQGPAPRVLAGRPDRLREHPRPQRPPLRLGRVRVGGRALRRQRRRQQRQAADPRRGRGRLDRLGARQLAPAVQQRPQPARGRLDRALLDRPRRQLLHLADQRHAGQRRRDLPPAAAATRSPRPTATRTPATPRPRRPSIKRYTGNLWAGPKTNGLVLSSSDRNILDYHDCERFSGCPTRLLALAGPDLRGAERVPRRPASPCAAAGWCSSRGSSRARSCSAAVTPPTSTRSATSRSSGRRRSSTASSRSAARRRASRAPCSNRLDATARAKLRPYRVCGRA